MNTTSEKAPNGNGNGVAPAPLIVGADPSVSLRDEFIGRINDLGLTQTAAATKVGTSASALSQWLKGSYRGNNRGLEDKIIKFLRSTHENEQFSNLMPRQPAWARTETAEEILQVLTYCQMGHTMGAVYGDPGTGKTVTCHHYKETHNNVWVAEMSRVDARLAPTLQAICEAIGIANPPLRIRHMYTMIVEALKGTDGLLIIDEAQHLSHDSLEQVRAIHDKTGIGVVLAGNEEVYARVTGGLRDVTFAQLFRRVSIRKRIKGVLKGDIAPLLARLGVEDKKVAAFLKVIAAKPGALGLAVETWRLASMYAAADDAPLTVECVERAWAVLGAER